MLAPTAAALSAHVIRCAQVTKIGAAKDAIATAELPMTSIALAENELLVRTSFAGLNFIDTYYRSGLYNNGKGFPYVTGDEGSGAVVQLGPNAAPAWLGKRVAFFRVRPVTSGACAAFTILHQDDAIEVPATVTDETAAAVLLQGLTAHYLTHDCYRVGPGSTVVVHAAAGGTGLLISQIAKIRGATNVIGICGGAEKCDLARRVGKVDTVIDYTTPDGADWAKKIRSEICPTGVDAVFDGVGKATFLEGLKVLRPRGHMVTFGNASGAVEPIAPLLLTKYGSLVLQRPTLNHFIDRASGELDARVRDVFSWLREGSLQVHVGKVFPSLAHVADAHALIESKASTGKILINCQE